MSSFIEGLPDRLRTSRNNLGLSQREIAKRIGISYTTIGAYELGTRIPSPQILCKLALIYNVTTDYLLGLERPATNFLNINGLTKEEIDTLKDLIVIIKK
ncbi:MAG: helix-turn-helix transcriptional regulator [Lachnospiraceae bacterium]|nr:helix-turn-helix transcriptional regulator [Lachnospiraceae bacterium]